MRPYIYAYLRNKGTPVDDIDLLIARIAIVKDLVLITHNQKYCGKIEELEGQNCTL